MVSRQLELLVEERSMAQALKSLLPRIAVGVSCAVRTFNGKPDLLKKLPNRLAGYRHWPTGIQLGIVVVADQDDDNCEELLARLDSMALEAGFTCASVSRKTEGILLNRLAIKELEAWFFGDVPALVGAYPGVPASLGEKARYRDPDAIKGGTAEALERVLREAGHHKGGLAKGRAAEDIAAQMDVEVNTSRSFQKFRDGVRLLTAGGGNAQA
ncbi:DUF4276 family protein [soil metagenome]